MIIFFNYKIIEGSLLSYYIYIIISNSIDHFYIDITNAKKYFKTNISWSIDRFYVNFFKTILLIKS